eukprot:SAG11_NODE_1105_length_5858_cov_3.050009_7_plen_63_part_00
MYVPLRNRWGSDERVNVAVVKLAARSVTFAAFAAFRRHRRGVEGRIAAAAAVVAAAGSSSLA